MAKIRRVVLGVTGSIAAYRACDITRRLKREDIDVTVIMTEASTRFITPLTFQTLTSNPVFTDMFAAPRDWDPVHLKLADRGEVILVVPATANFIGKVASGIADDLLTSVVMASAKPVVICPAMNERMYVNKVVQANIAALKKLGYYFVGPVRGKLATGDEGMGRLARVDSIVARVRELL